MVSMSKILHYLEAFLYTTWIYILTCCAEDEGAVKGEIRPERSGGKRSRDAKIKFTSFLLSAPCRQLMLTKPETFCKPELTSHHKMPRKRVETICACLWEYLTTTSKSSLKLPLGAGPTCGWSPHWSPEGCGRCASQGSSVRFCQRRWGIFRCRELLKLASGNYHSRVWLGSLLVYLFHSENKGDPLG